MNKKISGYSVFFLMGTMLFTSCSCSKKTAENTPKSEEITKQKVNPMDTIAKDSADIYLDELNKKVQTTSAESFTHKITKLDNNTFAYSIFANGQLIIYQDVIPSMATPLGFKKKEDAEKVAKLVEEKLRNGISPPAVSSAELRGLGITE